MVVFRSHLLEGIVQTNAKLRIATMNVLILVAALIV